MTFDEFDSAIARNESALDFGKCTIGEYDDELKRIFEQIKADVIDECKQILLSAIAKDGKTKCHEYMIALNEMEQLKEQKNEVN